MSSYTKIGTAVTGTASATTVTFVTNTVLNVGELGIVRYLLGAASRPAGLTMTDSAGNTYAIAIDVGVGGSAYACIFWTVATVQLASGSNVVATTNVAQPFRGIDMIKCANPASSTPLDSPTAKGNTGTSTAALSGTSVVPASSDWVGVTAIDYTAAGVAPGTVGGTWIEDADVSSVGMETQALIGTSTTAVAGAGTLNSSGLWACVVAVFSLSSAEGTPGSRTAIPFTQGAGGGAFGGGGPH